MKESSVPISDLVSKIQFVKPFYQDMRKKKLQISMIYIVLYFSVGLLLEKNQTFICVNTVTYCIYWCPYDGIKCAQFKYDIKNSFQQIIFPGYAKKEIMNINELCYLLS